MRFAVHRSLQLCCWASALLTAAAAAQAESAYVPNEGSGTVTVIDTATDEPTALIPKTGSMGKKLRGVALDAAGHTLFVIDAIGNTVLVVDTSSGKIKKTLSNINSAEGIQLSPDTKTMAVCAEAQNQAVFIDVATESESYRVRIQGTNPEHCVWSPDGKWLLTSDEDSHSVDVIDVAARKSVRLLKTAGAARGMAFLPDGSAVYVADETSGDVDVISTASWSITKSIPIGVRPAGISVRPDGKRVYATAGGSGTVSVIDPQSNTVVATIKVGNRPWNMALTHDGAKLYVANGRTDNVSVIDTTTNKVVHTIDVGERPWGVAVR